MAETWRPVPGCEGCHEVSSEGRVRSIKRGLMVARMGNRRYLRVDLKHGDRRQFRTVHRMVAEAFLGTPPPHQVARHLDGNTENNRLSNLAWGTESENQLDKVRHGRHHEANKTHCIHGHEFTPENTRATPRQRTCLTCERSRRRSRRRRLTGAAS